MIPYHSLLRYEVICDLLLIAPNDEYAEACLIFYQIPYCLNVIINQLITWCTSLIIRGAQLIFSLIFAIVPTRDMLYLCSDKTT